MFFASGNNGYQNGINYPACAPSTISVGASTKEDAVASYSNKGDLLDLLAPGSNIQSTIPENTYQEKSGTSMAAPHAAGAALLLKQQAHLQNKNISVEEIRALLKTTGKDIQGYPRIDIKEALLTAVNNYNIISEESTIDHTYGKINYSSQKESNQFASCVNIKRHKITVDSVNCPQYNSSAQITFKDVTLLPPVVVLMDEEPCPPSVCTEIELKNESLKVNVSHFTTFSLQQILLL